MCHPYIENKSHDARAESQSAKMTIVCSIEICNINECGRTFYAGLTGMIVYISESAVTLSM